MQPDFDRAVPNRVLRPANDIDHSLASEFRVFVEDSAFPCLGAKAALHRDGLSFVVARDFRSDADDLRTLHGLFDLAAHYRREPALYQSLVVLFEAGAPSNEQEFERLLWARLQSLSDKDAWLGQSPDPRVADDPDDPHFAISFGGEAFFVIGLGPCSSRPARRFRCPGLVFNLHDQFERLRADGHYHKLRSTIIARDSILAGSVNPMLAEHGTASAARQYSGREVGDDWRCPFSRSGGAIREPVMDEAGLGDVVRRIRISCLYRWRHGRWPDLDRPATFTEWVQSRKLNDRGERLAMLTDKLHSKSLVADRCGANLCVPTLWSGAELPDDPPGEFPMVVKANHGSDQVQVVRSIRDWRRVQRVARRWVSGVYGGLLDERHYRAARRLVLVEPFLGIGDRLPDDYKVYVFGDRAAIVQHHVDRGTPRHRWTQFDRAWTRVGGARSEANPPKTLTTMLETAERLAAGFDFLRVDFYEVDGRLWFGEFALCPGSGLDPFEPVALDRQLGLLWSASRTH